MAAKLGRPVGVNEALEFCIEITRQFQDGTFKAMMVNQLKPPN